MSVGPFEQFITAFGGRLIKDGKLDVGAENRKAVIDALKFHTQWYFENKAPKGVTEWGDPDNNTNLQTHMMSMTLNATLSIPRWFYDKARDKYFNETASANYPQPGPLGKPYPVLTNIYPMIIPANAPNMKEAKAFADFFMQKKSYDRYIRGVEARFFPMYRSTFDSSDQRLRLTGCSTLVTPSLSSGMVGTRWSLGSLWTSGRPRGRQTRHSSR